MFLIVGLGNPGEKYHNNRHNIGFKIIDFLTESLNATKQSSKGFKGELYKATFKTTSILLLKPETFMNLSGESVLSVLNFYKINDFLVIHDELDLPFGSIKFKFDGSSGGHNGLKSIDTLCGSAYYRIRYGIGKPQNKAQVISWVLNDFSKDEEEVNKNLIPHCAKAALEITQLDSAKDLANKISQNFTLIQKAKDSSDFKDSTKEKIK
ncbi:MAG: aminoacyl-tRNA hydrolase [Helicobacter sp.]|nr:aminoacyl-tRNA hydrolase [Helicobacteraceae bacterium]MDY3114352.1 aminoacyl-tRNA hydrolase [Helicobacter sp.]